MFVVGGESLVDLKTYPERTGGVIQMHAHPGGSPMNCAIALSKLGASTGFLCPISKDAFGDYILEPLAAAGVEVLLKDRVDAYTTLAVVSDDGRGNPRYAFYREADRAFTREGLISALPKDLTVFQTGGFAPIDPVDAAVWLEVVKAAAARGATISLDPNVRPSLIDDMAGYRQRLDAFLDLAHIIKVSEEDLAELDKTLSLEAHAAAMLARPNCKLAIVTLGAEGSLAFTAAGKTRSAVYPAAPGGDNVGAGDTLMAGVLTWLADHGALAPAKLGALDAKALGEMLWFGAVAAGINCSRIGANPPTRAEVDAVLAKG